MRLRYRTKRRVALLGGTSMLNRRHFLNVTLAGVSASALGFAVGKANAQRSTADPAFRSGGAGRRLGPDRPHHGAGPAHRELICGAQITQCRRRRWHRRPAAVRQPVEGPSQRADGRRHGDGRRDHRQQGPVKLTQITPIARLTGEFEAIVVPAESAVQDAEGYGGGAEGRPGKVPGAAARPAAPTTSCSA